MEPRLDDERRLFYVAVTRARERLFLLDTAALSASRRSVSCGTWKDGDFYQNRGYRTPQTPPGQSHVKTARKCR